MSIAIQWAVFPVLNSDAMIATGVTDKPAMARSIVEKIMTISPAAGWGEIVRFAVLDEPPTDAELNEWPPPGEPPTDTELNEWPPPGEPPTDTELNEWPQPGEVYICRRAANDGEYKWMPLFPVNR
jgi:hypothetical protein